MALNGRYPSSAAIEGPRLLLCDGQSLTLVNYETGAQLWSYGVGPNPVARALKPQVMGNFMMQGATLSERFVAAHVTMPEGQLLVLDAADGKVLWKNKLQGTPVGSPVFWRDSILSASSTGVALFDAATGKKLQEWGHQSLIRPPDVIPGDRVLVSTNAFIFCYSLTTGQRLWSKPFNPFGWVSSLVPDRVGDKDCLIMAVAGNKVVCVDAATGQEIWSRASDANEQVQGQLQVVDDMVCFIRMKQTPPTFECRVVMLDAKTGQEKWVSAVLKDVNIFDLVVGTDAVAALTSRMERQANVGPRYVSAEIYCFDRATGQVVQSVKPAKQGNVGFGFGKLVAVDRMLWIVSYNDIVGFKGE
jgi:outer membrane protein assembly factor BamB